MERGPWSSLAVFTPAARLHPVLEGELYEEACRDKRVTKMLPNAIIYVDTPTEVCYQRMMNRGIDYEADISLPYLDKIDTLYKDALDGYDGFVYKVDGTLPKHTLAKRVAYIINHLYDLHQLTVDHPLIHFVPPSLPQPSLQESIEYEQYRLLQNTRVPYTTGLVGDTQNTLPGGTTLAALGQTTPEVAVPSKDEYTKFYITTDALVLYQRGPGCLEFSDQLTQAYEAEYHIQPTLYTTG
jgi:hypothetical protein